MRRPALQLPLLALVLFSCTDHDPTGPGLQPTAVESRRGPIVDAVHNGGNKHFYFLPPLGRNPKKKGEFNPNLSPVVEICELASNRQACVEPQPPGLPLQLTMDGSGPDAIRLEDEKYVLDWDTNGRALDPAVDYRIRVFAVAGGAELGHIDFDLVESHRNGLRSRLKAAVRRGLLPVPIGITLPIRFRIEQGVLCEDPSDCTEVVVGNAGATVVTPTSFAGVQIPEGALDAPVLVSVERVDVTAEPCLPTDMIQAEGCYRYDTDPALSDVQSSGLDEFNEDVVVGICIDPDVMLLPEHHEYALHKYDPDQPELGLAELTSAAVDYLDCAEFSALALAERSALMQLAHAGWERIAPLARLLGPREVRALNRGFGGLTKSFSQIGWARALTFTVIAGNGQSGGAGSRLPVDPVVRVTAAHWDPEEYEEAPPVQGIEVTFTFTDAAANVTVATDTSDADGIASVPWTLGAGAGAQTLRVTGAARESVELVATVTGVAPRSSGRLAVGDAHACAIADGATSCWGLNHVGTFDGGILGTGSTVRFESRPVVVSGNFVRLTAGVRHTCALDATDRAWCWGQGTSGQLGNGQQVSSTVPVPAAAGHAFVDITAGVFHTCGLTAEGEAWCWGGNGWGELGVADAPPESLTPLRVEMPEGATLSAISAGAATTCALTVAGEAYCWGNNTSGQLGNGTTVNSPTPSPVAGDHGFTSIVVAPTNSIMHATCALEADGSAWCWGSNEHGQLGSSASPTTCTVGTLTRPCALTPQAVAGNHAFSRVTSGRTHSCGTTTSGQLLCWGDNAFGQLGDGTTTDRAIPHLTPIGGLATDIGSGGDFTCAEISDAVWCWGRSHFGQVGTGIDGFEPAPVPLAGSGWTSASGNPCAATESGVVHCWGRMPGADVSSGTQALTGTSEPTPIGGPNLGQLSGSCGLDDAGVAYCWGQGPLGDGTSGPRSIPAPVTGDHRFSSISANGTHACAVDLDNRVWCWGLNQLGQLGNNSTLDSPVPVQASSTESFAHVAVGGNFTCATTLDARVLCWGFGRFGQLGVPLPFDPGYRSSPEAIPSLGGASMIAAGANSACAVADDQLMCWGSGYLGDGGDTPSPGVGPVAVPGMSAVSALSMSGHTCAVNAGALYCWGGNFYGQLGDGTFEDRASPILIGLTGVVEIATGSSLTCARQNTGRIECFGDNTFGATGALLPNVLSPTRVF